jgi:hypothetical protein
MKSVVYVLAFLLLAGIGGSWFFYSSKYRPMAEDYRRMKTDLPDADRAGSELRKYRDRERWIGPTVEALRTGLDDEMKAGLAEVIAAPNGTVVVNIAETVLYTPGVVTFGKDSLTTLRKLASLIKNLKDLSDKDILIANTTISVPPQGTGRKKKPGMEGRELAMKRSLALVKYLVEKEGAAPDLLVAAAAPEKMPDRGFKIKDRKTMLVIIAPPSQGRSLAEAAGAVPLPGASAPAGTQPAPPRPAAPGPAAQKTGTGPAQIPIKQAPQPKAQ